MPRALVAKKHFDLVDDSVLLGTDLLLHVAEEVVDVGDHRVGELDIFALFILVVDVVLQLNLEYSLLLAASVLALHCFHVVVLLLIHYLFS